MSLSRAETTALCIPYSLQHGPAQRSVGYRCDCSPAGMRMGRGMAPGGQSCRRLSLRSGQGREKHRLDAEGLVGSRQGRAEFQEGSGQGHILLEDWRGRGGGSMQLR